MRRGEEIDMICKWKLSDPVQRTPRADETKKKRLKYNEAEEFLAGKCWQMHTNGIGRTLENNQEQLALAICVPIYRISNCLHSVTALISLGVSSSSLERSPTAAASYAHPSPAYVGTGPRESSKTSVVLGDDSATRTFYPRRHSSFVIVVNYCLDAQVSDPP